jgi:hypothetical protein
VTILLLLRQMSRAIVSGVMGFLFFACGLGSVAAETLGDTLRAANVPTQQFTASELGGKITSYDISKDDPFLLAYYADDGSGSLHAPLHVIRYGRAAADLRRGDVDDTNALPQNCFGSVLRIREYFDTIYVETDVSPSAVCAIVLSSGLSFQTVLPGWLLGFLGADYAILQRGEIHFMSVSPMHIEVFDLKRKQLVEVYPYKDDTQRRQFSNLIEPHIVQDWCGEHNAACDPENFDTELTGGLALNEAAKVFGFEAEFDAAGFGDAAEKQVPTRTVAYIFRERGGIWDHREFPPGQLQNLFGVMSIQDLVGKKPNTAFEPAGK